MKPGLNHWKGTRETLEALQELCHFEHMQDIGTSNPQYTATTTAFTKVYQPEGEVYSVMRVPSGVVKKRSLIDKMNAHNTNIEIVKSKKTWNRIEAEDGV